MIEVVDVGEALKDFNGRDVSEEGEGADHKEKPIVMSNGVGRGEGLSLWILD